MVHQLGCYGSLRGQNQRQSHSQTTAGGTAELKLCFGGYAGLDMHSHRQLVSLFVCEQELNAFRGKCSMLFHYDMISVPLVYTQVSADYYRTAINTYTHL